MIYVWKNNSGFGCSTFTGDRNIAENAGYVAITKQQYTNLQQHTLCWQNGELVPYVENKEAPTGIIFGSINARTMRFVNAFAERGITVKVVNKTNYKNFSTDNLRFVMLANQTQKEYFDNQKDGLFYFNKPESVLLARDKLFTHKVLEEVGISQPQTQTTDENITFPVVVKARHGSLGRQVYLCNNAKELCILQKTLADTPHIYQHFVETSRGRDMRVICIGKRAFAWYVRRNDNDFRANLAQGGHGIVCELPEEFRIVCEQTASALDLDFCGIDVLFGENQQPLVCEVNSHPMVDGVESVTGKNIVNTYVDYIAQKIA